MDYPDTPEGVKPEKKNKGSDFFSNFFNEYF